MACPLCNTELFKPSWFGITHFDEKDFEYVECQFCKSLYCFPMPNEETLEKMYGLDYFGLDHENVHTETVFSLSSRFEKPLNWLKSQQVGLLLDYGCGSGVFLKQAKKNGWQTIGLDFDPQVAEKVYEEIGVKIVTSLNDLGKNFQADVLHLGDVCEHLTNVNEQIPEILKLLKPGGYLLAQGPLEANFNLFTNILKFSRKLRKNKISEMPPFHVMLATMKGQKIFFSRFGLNEIKFEVSEVAHPAPDRLDFSDILDLRKVSMFALRCASQIISSMNATNWGNRYFYVGKVYKN